MAFTTSFPVCYTLLAMFFLVHSGAIRNDREDDPGDKLDELETLTADTYNETTKYKGAVFFGHMNPDTDSVGEAYAAAEFFGGIAACPMKRDKCPNAETSFLMQKFDVPLDSVPVLRDVPELRDKKVVLVDFNAPKKGPESTFGYDIPKYAYKNNKWKSPPVLGLIDHHALQFNKYGKNGAFKQPKLFYEQVGRLVVETHAWGSGCSIMAMKFKQRVSPPPSKKASGLMLGGILSDTLGLTGPTTTEYDKEAVEYLMPFAKVANKDEFYEEQAVSKSRQALIDPLHEVFDSDLKAFDIVQGTNLVIGAVEVYGTSVYNELLGKDVNELKTALHKVKQKYGSHPTFIWVIDTQNKVSTLLMDAAGPEKCIALHAMDKLNGVALPVECRPGEPQAQDMNDIVLVGSGSCVSRKSQAQPTLTAAVQAYTSGDLTC